MTKRISIEEKIYQKIFQLQANEDFMKDILDIRKKYNESFEAVELENGEMDLKFRYDDFQKDIQKLREKYNLTSNYQEKLYEYISKELIINNAEYGVSGYPKTELIPSNDGLNLGVDEETGQEEIIYPYNWGEQCIAIKIFPETTLNDFIDNWDEIARERDRLYEVIYGIKGSKGKRMARSKNIERDYYIYELWKKGMTTKQIVKEFNKNKKFGNVVIGYEEVPNIIKRLKEKANRDISSKIT